MKILGQFTPITITDLYQFLAEHPDAILVTDTKYKDPQIVRKQFGRLVEAAAPYHYKVLMRVIPQLYSTEMYSVIENIFPFRKYAYTLYQTKDSDKEIIDFVRKNKIHMVTMNPERYSEALGAQLKKSDAMMFLHSINDIATVRKYTRKDVDGFYTDCLSSMDIEKEQLSYKLELNTRKQMISEFLIVRFNIPYEEIQKVFISASLDDLTRISFAAFQMTTVDEINDLLKSI
jgi:glycerophosphoryl diester phosphodiesterase